MDSKIRIFLQCLILIKSLESFAAILENPTVYRNAAFANWFHRLNNELQLINQYSAYYEWELSTNPDDPIKPDAIKFSAFKSEWVHEKCHEAIDLNLFSSKHQTASRLNRTLINMISKILCDGPKFTSYQTRELTNVLHAMQNIYTNTRICLPKHFDVCSNLDRIWEFTYIQEPSGQIHYFDLSEVAPKGIHQTSKLKYFNAKNFSENSQVHATASSEQSSVEMRIRSGSMVCFESEPDLEQIMKGDFSILQRNDCSLRFNVMFRWAWESWRLAVGTSIQELYPKLAYIMNIGARNNGFRDIGDLWRHDVDLPDVETKITDLVNQIEPFYKLLHGILRHSLWKRVNKFENFEKNKTIPAHLLGSMWSQNWELYRDLILPFSEVNLDKNLKQLNWTSRAMIKKADDFYISLGLPKMAKTFWEKSYFKRDKDFRNCHGTAANMFNGSDYRMIICSTSTWDDLYVIVHEMGHLHYYMAFKDQPAIFQDANFIMQESIGDAIFLGVMSPQNLNRLELLPDKFLYVKKLPKLHQSTRNGGLEKDEENLKRWKKLMILGKLYPHLSRLNEMVTNFDEYKSKIDQSINAFDLSFLLRMALIKIPQIPFQYILDVFRWNVFNGTVPVSRANEYFWDLAINYQGIHPPDWENRNKFFDPGAKYHVADNTPYVRYFLASFVQAQIFRGLCQITIFGYVEPIKNLPMPLHRCDIYGSKRAGKLLKKALQLGSSVHWTEVLYILTGSREISVDALLLYYQPLIVWLEKLSIDFDIPIGW